MMPVEAVVLDIEGTTTDVAFATDPGVRGGPIRLSRP